MTQETTALEEHVRFVGGGTPSRKRQEYYQGTIPWVTVKDLGEGLFLHDTQEKITPEAVENSATNVIDSGHILVCTRMAVGKAVLTSKPVAINQDLKAIYHSKHLETKFLLFYLKAKQSQLEAVATGATVKGITLDELRALQIPVLSIPQQRAIAQRLERADRLRRLRRHALDISDQYLQTVFLEMFGDPETNPKGWQREELGELIQRFEGGTNFPPVADSAPCSKYRVLKISAVTWGNFDPAESKPIAVETKIKPEIVVRKGDLLFSRANTSELVGSVAMVAVDPPPVVLPDKVWRIVFGSDPRLDPYYTMTFLRSSFARKQISDLATGSSGSMKNISMGKANTLVLTVPPLALQGQYASVVHKHERLRRMQVEALRQANLLYETLLEEAFGESGAG